VSWSWVLLVVMAKAGARDIFIGGVRSISSCSRPVITCITSVDCRPSYWRWSLSVKAWS
jgi:hypothetical protein